MTIVPEEKEIAMVAVNEPIAVEPARAMPQTRAVPATRAVHVGNDMTTSTPKRANCMAITSLVLGIISFVFFGLLLGPLAIIFGCVGMKQINENPNELSGMCQAKAGIICGIISTVLWLIIIIVAVSG
jgi:uncharacterized protein with PQ loop repeat